MLLMVDTKLKVQRKKLLNNMAEFVAMKTKDDQGKMVNIAVSYRPL